jgi:C4-dicarboxylate transporter DctM subunit
LATIVPGVLWGLGYILVNRLIYFKYYHKTEIGGKTDNDEFVEKKNRTLSFWAATKTAIPAFIMPIIILGGIYSGAFTPTEAGAVSGLYAVLAGLFIYKKFRGKTLLDIFANNGVSLGTLCFIFPFAMIFSRIMVTEGVPQALMGFITGITSNKVILLLLIDLLLLLVGCFFDAPILSLVLPPIMTPTMEMLGVGSVQFGVIVFVALGIGAFTPPMAVHLFVAAKVGNIELRDILPPLMPLLFIIAIPVLILVTFVPALSNWLPGLVLGFKP